MSKETKKIHLALAEDHHLMRESLGETLKKQGGLQLVISAANGRELLDAMMTVPVDVVLMDLDMPVMNGKDAMALILANYPKTRVIIFSMHSDPWMVLEIMQAGASSFVSKGSSITEMVTAIKSVFQNGRYFSKDIPWGDAMNSNVGLEFRLSFNANELYMIQMICDGKTSEEIANLMHLSKKAIDARRAELLKRMDAKNPIDFVRKCMLHALYKPRTDEEIKASDEAREKERKMKRG